MRHRFLTDHLFGAQLLGFDDFTELSHRRAIDLYFPKNPKLPMHAQDPIHKRAHLDPRKTFKTTLKRVDRLQWICAFPEEVTILIESSTQPLAEGVSCATSKFFYSPSGKPSNNMQHLFPELIVVKEPGAKWNTPNRRLSGAGDLDKTLDFTSPKSTQSGWHPFVMEPDDVEDTNNSGIGVNDDVRQHVIDVCDQNENLLRKGGFINICGTRYHPFDYYGKCIERAERSPNTWKILVRATIRVKNGARLLPNEFPDEDDIEILFPDITGLGYDECRDMYYQNYESFMCQQQNDPQGGAVATFDEKLYAGCLTAPERIPLFGGETFVCWRLPYAGKDHMDRAEGAAGRIIDGKIFITDCWTGSYTPTRLAERIVRSQKEHQADGLILIQTPGSEYMATQIRNEANRRNVSLRIMWAQWEEDDHYRTVKIEQLEPMLRSGRILFSTAMTRHQECRKQFVHYGLIPENGIIECVSKFADRVPLSQLRASMEDEEIEWHRRRRQDGMLEAFMNAQGMPQADELTKQKMTAHVKAVQAATTFNMPPLPGGLDG
jgi:hypothetical protein